MRPFLNAAVVYASDPVAAAVENHLREMEAGGHGRLTMGREGGQVWATFGTARVEAETYDIALVRLAGEVLSDVHIGKAFLHRIRSSVRLPGRG